MTERLVIGVRPDGQAGIFVSPPGISALYAPGDQLLLSVTGKTTQLLLLGVVYSSQSVGLGFGARPMVLVTSSANLSEIVGYESYAGPTRPSPLGYNTATSLQLASATVQGGGAYMDVECSSRTVYAVYNRAF